MSEEEKTQPSQEQEEREQPSETASIVERAEQTVIKMKEQNDRYEQLVFRNEEAKAHNLLGGRAEAGDIPEVKEETDEDFVKKFEAGEIDLLK